jgi:hypothetical protein
MSISDAYVTKSMRYGKSVRRRSGFEFHPPAGEDRAAFASQTGVDGIGPHSTAKFLPALPGHTNVFLVGCATTVPFTAVSTGPQRTATDNATVAATRTDAQILS